MISEYAAELIYENIYSETDPDGNEFFLLNDILDHRSTAKTLNPEDAFEGESTNSKYKKTTAVWEILVEWADNNWPQSWISFKDLNNRIPFRLLSTPRRTVHRGRHNVFGGFPILSGSA